MLITRPRRASGAIIWSAVLTPATATIEARPTISSTSAASHTRLTAERTQSPAHETPAAAASRGKVGSARGTESERARHGADPDRRHQQSERPGSSREHVASQQRDVDGEIEDRDGHDEEHAEEPAHARGAGGVAQPLEDLLAEGGVAQGDTRSRRPHRGEGERADETGERVEQEGRRQPEGADEHTGDGGPHDAGAVERDRVQRDRVPDVLA